MWNQLGVESSQSGGDDADYEVGSVACEGDRARRMVGGYKLLHASGDGRSNGVGLIV